MAAWRVVESVAVDQSGDDFWWQTARRGNGGPAAVRVAAPLRHAIGSSLALLLPRRFSLISAFGVVRVKTPTEIRSTIKKNPKKLRKFKRKNFPSLRFIFCKKKKNRKTIPIFCCIVPIRTSETTFEFPNRFEMGNGGMKKMTKKSSLDGVEVAVSCSFRLQWPENGWKKKEIRFTGFFI